MHIADLAEGQQARVLSITAAAPELEAKLREIGFCEGDDVQLLTRGPLGGQPLAVRLNRRIIAMRNNEAASVIVEPVR
jgi:ferrous iron transport protein A